MIATLDPYALLIKLGLVAALVGALFVGGCVHGQRGQASKDQAALMKASGDLGNCAASLDAASLRFREIDAATAQAQKDAAQRATQAQQAEQQARAGQQALASQLLELQRQAERDKQTCSIEEARVCGSVLR